MWLCDASVVRGLLWSLLAAGFCAAPAAPAAAPLPRRSIQVQAQGVVTAPTNAVTSRWGLSPTVSRVRYAFGLPTNAPVQRWLEDDALPICQTSWEQAGIRYTQKVLLTTTGTNDPTAASPASADAVLLVQITGHNVANEYTTASAVFEVQAGDRPLNLEWRDGLVFVAGSNTRVPLAAVDIASEGVAGTNGLQLRFRGHMPPGTSGSMTIKIPAGPREHAAAIEQLRDLEFDEEFRRVKRLWKDRPGLGRKTWPVIWAVPELAK
jgi:hypothetical protein